MGVTISRLEGHASLLLPAMAGVAPDLIERSDASSLLCQVERLRPGAMVAPTMALAASCLRRYLPFGAGLGQRGPAPAPQRPQGTVTPRTMKAAAR